MHRKEAFLFISPYIACITVVVVTLYMPKVRKKAFVKGPKLLQNIDLVFLFVRIVANKALAVIKSYLMVQIMNLLFHGM